MTVTRHSVVIIHIYNYIDDCNSSFGSSHPQYGTQVAQRAHTDSHWIHAYRPNSYIQFSGLKYNFGCLSKCEFDPEAKNTT